MGDRAQQPGAGPTRWNTDPTRDYLVGPDDAGNAVMHGIGLLVNGWRWIVGPLANRSWTPGQARPSDAQPDSAKFLDQPIEATLVPTTTQMFNHDPTLAPARLTAATVAVALAGCGTDTTTTEPSPTPPTSSTQSPTIGGTASESVQGLLDTWASEGRGGVAVALAGCCDELIVAAAGSAGPDGGTVEPDSAFRVGSLSKTFVAVMILQLVGIEADLRSLPAAPRD